MQVCRWLKACMGSEVDQRPSWKRNSLPHHVYTNHLQLRKLQSCKDQGKKYRIPVCPILLLLTSPSAGLGQGEADSIPTTIQGCSAGLSGDLSCATNPLGPAPCSWSPSAATAAEFIPAIKIITRPAKKACRSYITTNPSLAPLTHILFAMS